MAKIVSLDLEVQWAVGSHSTFLLSCHIIHFWNGEKSIPLLGHCFGLKNRGEAPSHLNYKWTRSDMLTRTGGATSKWERGGITMATYYNFSFHNKKEPEIRQVNYSLSFEQNCVGQHCCYCRNKATTMQFQPQGFCWLVSVVCAFWMVGALRSILLSMLFISSPPTNLIILIFF